MIETHADITVQDVKQLLDAGSDFLLLDCRTPEEFEEVHLESAKLIPMADLQERVGELEAFRSHRIVVHCHLGVRSESVTQWLRARGFRIVQNMQGGIDAWAEQIDPSLPRY